ncbi:hypothetical protein GE09DRAFT_391200 [Coniochaeta sp. 2T2.1]|nr:hypothetical protein GE09DRAFT_391200 [Coniochaeta sp. 2T2.1]
MIEASFIWQWICVSLQATQSCVSFVKRDASYLGLTGPPTVIISVGGGSRTKWRTFSNATGKGRAFRRRCSEMDAEAAVLERVGSLCLPIQERGGPSKSNRQRDQEIRPDATEPTGRLCGRAKKLCLRPQELRGGEEYGTGT